MAETAVIERTTQRIPELWQDHETRLQAAQFIGACLMGETVERGYAEESLQRQPIESLLDALQLAAEGDQPARQLVRTNVATDVIERTIKSGHVIAVELQTDEAGRIQQFGQSMESIQANSLRYASDSAPMLARTKAETLNSFRIADLHRRGSLEDYNFVVFSRAADDMDEAAMRSAGFFTETMSMAIQVTSAEGDTLMTESAFVAGKTAASGRRHDGATMQAVGARLGVDIDPSATELLAAPLLIPKQAMPDGVIDLVRLYDDCAGDTFFGERKPRQDYRDYREQCREREEQFAPIVERITNTLIEQATTVTTRTEAVERLHQLSQDHMVQQAVGDASIDARVFGPAEAHIIAARQALERGDYDTALQEAGSARRTAVSSSCPSGKLTAADENGLARSSERDTLADCSFVSKECPKCHKKNVWTTVSKGRIRGACGCSAKQK